MRPSHRDASVAAGHALHAEALGRHAQRQRGRSSGREVSGNLPTDFGFPIDVHAHEPETIYVVPIKSDSEHFPPEGKLRVYRSKTGGDEWEALTNGLPQKDCYVNVLRDAMCVDPLDDAASISARPADRFIVRPMAAIPGRRSCAICRRCCRWKCRRCHDPRGACRIICARWRGWGMKWNWRSTAP